MCDANERYFQSRIQDMQDSYMRAQMGKMGTRPMTSDEKQKSAGHFQRDR